MSLVNQYWVLTIPDNALANSAAINGLKAEVCAIESHLVCQLNRRFAGHFRSELNANALLRDNLGADKHTQDVEAIGNAFQLKGWVNAVIFGGQRFIEPGCNAVHGVRYGKHLTFADLIAPSSG